MQYIDLGTKDLQQGSGTYVLKASDRKVNFFAYTGETSLNANEQDVKYNAYKRGYFLRKVFYSAQKI